MNDRSYERAPAAIGQEAQLTQAGFVNRVFGWMTGGLALTAGISYAIANSTMQDFVIQNRGAFLGLLIVEVLLVIGLSAAINKISSFVAGLGFALFAALNGVTLSWIFMAYEPTAIYRTFFTTRNRRHVRHGVVGVDRRDADQYVLGEFDVFVADQHLRRGSVHRPHRLGYAEDQTDVARRRRGAV